MIIHLMKKIHKGMNTWWKFSVATDREQKLKNWAKGYRPEITGADSQSKRSIHEPEPLTGLEYLTGPRGNNKYKGKIVDCDHTVLKGYAMLRLIDKMRWAIYRIGMNQEEFTEMIKHNKVQTNNQKARRTML